MIVCAGRNNFSKSTSLTHSISSFVYEQETAGDKDLQMKGSCCCCSPSYRQLPALDNMIAAVSSGQYEQSMMSIKRRSRLSACLRPLELKSLLRMQSLQLLPVLSLELREREREMWLRIPPLNEISSSHSRLSSRCTITSYSFSSGSYCLTHFTASGKTPAPKGGYYSAGDISCAGPETLLADTPRDLLVTVATTCRRLIFDRVSHS
jgi:hypothetical protein